MAWPKDNKGGWNHNAAEFVSLLSENKCMWLHLTRAKYLDIHIDTRDGAFTLRDRDGNVIDPDDVVEACHSSAARYGRHPWSK